MGPASPRTPASASAGKSSSSSRRWCTPPAQASSASTNSTASRGGTLRASATTRAIGLSMDMASRSSAWSSTRRSVNPIACPAWAD